MKYTKYIFALLIMFAHLSSCTHFEDPEPIFEEDNQENTRPDRRFLHINIEGAVGEIVKEVNPEVIASLLPHSKYSFYGIAEEKSNEATTMTSLMTGVAFNKHKIEFPDYTGEVDTDGHSDNTFRPGIFYRILTNKPYYGTFAFTSNPILIENLMREAIDKKTLDTDEGVKNHAIEYLKTSDSKFGVIDFTSVQQAGLESGFSINNADYVEAIKQVDAYIGDILETIKNRENSKNEKWMISIQSNNGGKGTEQGGNTESERNTFAIYYYPSFKEDEYKKQITSSTRFYTINNHSNRNVARTNDGEYLDFTGDEMTVELFTSRNQEMTSVSNPFMLGKTEANNQNQHADRPGWFFILRQNSLAFHATVGGSKSVFLSGGSTITKQWTHFAAVMKRNDTEIDVRFYQDGSLIASNSISISPGEKIVSPRDFHIGARNPHNGFQSVDLNFKDFRAWNKALTQDELKAHACMEELPADLSYLDKLEAHYPLMKDLKSAIAGKPDLVPHQDFNNDFPMPVTAWSTFCSTNVYVPGNVDLAPNVFYWLEIEDKNWGLDGELFIKQFDQEFYNQ